MTYEELKHQFEQLSAEFKQTIDQSVSHAVKNGIQAIVKTEREYTSKAIREAILEARCDCPVHDTDKNQIRHLIDCIRDLGEGELNCGIRELRANHVWTCKMRQTQGWLSKTVLGAFLVIIASGVAGILWTGFRILIGINNGSDG